ncbi:MAG: GreA/GreB family elongation factor [Phycisphaerae bacterium]
MAALRLPPATSEQAFSLRPQPPFLSHTRASLSYTERIDKHVGMHENGESRAARSRQRDRRGRCDDAMQLDEALKLVGSGNSKDVESQWLALIERDDTTPAQIIALEPILNELAKQGKTEQAESLAWAAIESVTERCSPAEALDVCKPFLLTLNKSAELKQQATDLYLTVYADRDDLEALMEEAGIAGGRPPRRAIRTLDTCLTIKPGSYVVSRDDDTAARVESINTTNWQVTLTTGHHTKTLGCVEFADAHALCDEDDFRVLASFDRQRLQGILRKEPATVIENILKVRGNRLDSDDLQAVLTPRIIPADEWPKWWTRARAAIRKSRHIKLEGRSPYILEFISGGHNIHEEFAADFKHLDSPAQRFDVLDGFLRECKAREESPDTAILGKIRDAVTRRAAVVESTGAATSLAERLVESQIARAVGDPDPDGAAVALLASEPDPAVWFRACDSPALWLVAADCLTKARPQDWPETLAALFPWAPGSACDHLADMLDKSDLSGEGIEQTISTIIAEAETTYEALYWLWDKGLSRDNWRATPPLTILTRILALLAQVQRSDRFGHAVAKKVCAAARSALSARRYQRFEDCLSGIESGVAAALRTQLQRLDNLGRKVEEDLLNRVRRAFPELYKRTQIPLWACEDTLFATTQGIARAETEINELVNVKMRENAKAIGEAAAKGDLSENSEYRFALEERDLLRARLAHMQKQFSLARPLYPEEIPTDHLTVGSKVSFRHVDSGEVVELTFLGPFDADTEQHVYNYKAPFAQGLMGSRLGDRVELPIFESQGPYEIVRLGPWKDTSEAGGQ